MTALALTLVLAIVWLACIAVGYWHGGWRQIVLLAAMLLSYAVVSEWAVPNGHDLSTQFHWRIARTTTGVALLYVLGGTLVLGFLGSYLLPRPNPLTARERQIGATMGVLNGGLLLALILRTLRSYAYLAGGGNALHDSLLSRFLIEEIGYLILAAFAIGVVTVGVGLAFFRRPSASTASEQAQMATRAVPEPPRPPYFEPSPFVVPTASAPPTAPPQGRPEPVYATAPMIDWPTEPPAMMNEQATVAPPVPEVTPPQPAPVPRIPTRLSLPPRVPPPLVYPVAELIAAHTRPAVGQADRATVASAVAQPPAQSPVVTLPASPALPPLLPPRPTTPPPGALQPDPVPPVVAVPYTSPPSRPEPEPIGTAQAPLPVIEAIPAPPIVRELDVETRDAAPPAVRELDLTTHDAGPVATAAHEEGEQMDTREPVAAPSLLPAAVTETAPLATIPPPLPPMPELPPRTAPPMPARNTTTDPAASPEEQARSRSTFARVATPRQAGQNPPSPQPAQPNPQVPASPEPLQPPAPSGPRVHACPTCGYPVRDHARYCPNCGGRQRS